jgi:hypothetical protein
VATLPDGATVTSQYTTGWNLSDPDDPGSYSTQLAFGWNFEPPTYYGITMGVDTQTVKSGEAVTASGAAGEIDGPAVEGIAVDIELVDPDGSTSMVDAGTTDANGEYSQQLTLDTPGDWAITATMTRPGLRASEGWNA